MKPVLLIFLLTLMSNTVTFGQVKIGENPQNIDPSSVLELESTSRVLVITRVSTLEMEAIIPQRGGVVYNTDTECMHYYNGTIWINLCDATSFSLTNEPIENVTSTISIVDNGSTINLEVAPNSIRSENIVDGGINGDDIQDNSIGESKLGADSVGADELRDNTVGASEIIDGSITPIDMANTIPNQVLTTDSNGTVNWEDTSNLRGAVADEVSITGSGTAADPLSLTDAITANILSNTTAITAHVSADNDTDNQNEVLTSAALEGNELVLTESGVERRVDLGPLNNTGTDNQTLNLNVNSLEITNGNTVNLAKYLDNTDEQQLTLSGNRISLTDGGFVDLPPGTVDTDEQQLTIAGNRISLTDGGFVDLPAGTVDTDNQAITGGAVVGNELRIDIEDGISGTIDISSLTATGTDNNTTNSTLETTDADADGLDDTLTLTDSEGNTVEVALADISSATGSNTTNTSLTTTDTDADGTDDTLTLTDSAGNTVEILLADISSATGNNTTNTSLTTTDADADGTDDTLTLTDSAGNTVGIALADISSGGGADAQQLTLQQPGNLLTLQNGGTAIDLTPFLDDQDDSEVLLATPLDFDGDAIDETTVQGALTAIAAFSSDNQNDSEVLLLTPTDFDGDAIDETTVQGAITAIAASSSDDQNDSEVLLLTPTDFDGDAIDETTVQGAITAIAASSSDDQNDSEVLLLTPTDFDGDAVNETTVQGALTAIAASSSDDQNDSEVLLLTPTDFDGDAVDETTVQGALTAIAASSSDDQNDSEVQLLTPTDFDGDAVNETTVLGALNAISNTVGNNLSNTDLTLLAQRTHDLAGFNLILEGTGNVGIGNLPGAPQDKLDVDGQIRARNGFAASNGTEGFPTIGFYNDADTGIYRGNLVNYLRFSTGGNEAMTINPNQNIGIGINPTEKLHVDGNILATGTITPDYVFEYYFMGKSNLKPSYEMSSLIEIEEFVKLNKHLPGVPSAFEIEEQGGILVNRATEINLEKIEELFLHTIEQEEKIRTLSSEKEELATKLEALQNEVDEIKQMLLIKKGE